MFVLVTKRMFQILICARGHSILKGYGMLSKVVSQQWPLRLFT